LVEKLSVKTALTQKDIASVVDAFVNTIGEELKSRNEATLVGFSNLLLKISTFLFIDKICPPLPIKYSQHLS